MLKYLWNNYIALKIILGFFPKTFSDPWVRSGLILLSSRIPKTLKMVFASFCLTLSNGRDNVEKADETGCCTLGEGTLRDLFIFMWQTSGRVQQSI